MVAACDATIAYRTNPHIDQRQCGIDAAALLLSAIRGNARPTAALATPPMIINIDRQRTAVEPCASLYARAAEIRARPGVLSVSVVLGFPYADVEEMGSAFLVTADANAELAQKYVDELAMMCVQERRLGSSRAIYAHDRRRPRRGRRDGRALQSCSTWETTSAAGSPGDGTLLAEALARRPIGPAIVTIDDPAAVAQARAAGPGASVWLSLGGRCCDPRLGPPRWGIQATVVSRSL